MFFAARSYEFSTANFRVDSGPVSCPVGDHRRCHGRPYLSCVARGGDKEHPSQSSRGAFPVLGAAGREEGQGAEEGEARHRRSGSSGPARQIPFRPPWRCRNQSPGEHPGYGAGTCRAARSPPRHRRGCPTEEGAPAGRLPFSPTELVARIRAALRRRAAPDWGEPSEPYTSGDLAIDYAERRVTVGSCAVHVTATEYELLVALSAAGGGRVLTHDHLLQRVWSMDNSGDPRLVRTVVKRLRRRLGDDADSPKYIFTEPHVGYRMARADDPGQAS